MTLKEQTELLYLADALAAFPTRASDLLFMAKMKMRYGSDEYRDRVLALSAKYEKAKGKKEVPAR